MKHAHKFNLEISKGCTAFGEWPSYYQWFPCNHQVCLTQTGHPTSLSRAIINRPFSFILTCRAFKWATPE